MLGINDFLRVEYFGQDKMKCISDSRVPLQKGHFRFTGTLEYLHWSGLSVDTPNLILVKAFLMTRFLTVVKYGVSSCSCLKDE